MTPGKPRSCAFAAASPSPTIAPPTPSAAAPSLATASPGAGQPSPAASGETAATPVPIEEPGGRTAVVGLMFVGGLGLLLLAGLAGLVFSARRARPR